MQTVRPAQVSMAGTMRACSGAISLRANATLHHCQLLAHLVHIALGLRGIGHVEDEAGVAAVVVVATAEQLADSFSMADCSAPR